LTYLLTPRSRVLLEKQTSSEVVKKFPTFYGTWTFITAFTNAHHLSLSCARSIQDMPPFPISWRSILLSSHLLLHFPSGLFPSDFPTKTLHTPLLSPIQATCPTHLILLNLITRSIYGEQYRSLSSSLCTFVYFPVTSSLLGPTILRHPHPTFLLQCEQPSFTPIQNSNLEDSAPNDNKHSLTAICSKFLPEQYLDLRLFPNISTVPPFQRNYQQSLYCDTDLHSDLETRPCT